MVSRADKCIMACVKAKSHGNSSIAGTQAQKRGTVERSLYNCWPLKRINVRKQKYNNLGKLCCDLTVLPHCFIMVYQGNHPQTAQQFILIQVKYYGLYPEQWSHNIQQLAMWQICFWTQWMNKDTRLKQTIMTHLVLTTSWTHHEIMIILILSLAPEHPCKHDKIPGHRRKTQRPRNFEEHHSMWNLGCPTVKFLCAEKVLMEPDALIDCGCRQTRSMEIFWEPPHRDMQRPTKSGWWILCNQQRLSFTNWAMISWPLLALGYTDWLNGGYKRDQ